MNGLRQRPESIVEQVTAYHVRGPSHATDLNYDRETMSAGFHVAITVLYGGESVALTTKMKAVDSQLALLMDT